MNDFVVEYVLVVANVQTQTVKAAGIAGAFCPVYSPKRIRPA
jgi:hypothetical protein